MRKHLVIAALILSLLPSVTAFAQALPSPHDPDLPIAFASSVPDVCFGIANQNTIGPQTRLILDPLPKSPVEIGGMYPRVPTWYRLKKYPKNIFIGIGDKPNLCHIVLTNSQDGRESFSALSTLLRSVGFAGAWDARGSALLMLTKKLSTGNMIVLLKGLTDAKDGVGPQVSVDVGLATDDQLRQLLTGK